MEENKQSGEFRDNVKFAGYDDFGNPIATTSTEGAFYNCPPLSGDINDELISIPGTTPVQYWKQIKAEAEYEKACEDVLDELQRIIDYCKEARITANQLIEQHRYWAKMVHDQMAEAIAIIKVAKG